MPANKAVGMVKSTDPFGCLNGNNGSEPTRIHNLLHLLIEGRIAKDMTNDNFSVEALCLHLHFCNIFGFRGNRLLQKQIVTAPHGCNRLCAVLVVWGGNDGKISQLGLVEQRLGRIELENRGVATNLFYREPPLWLGIGHCHDGELSPKCSH